MFKILLILPNKKMLKDPWTKINKNRQQTQQNSYQFLYDSMKEQEAKLANKLQQTRGSSYNTIYDTIYQRDLNSAFKTKLWGA